MQLAIKFINMNPLNNFLLCIVFILPNFVHGNDFIAKPNITLVDRYTNEYLDAEETLWAVILRREDSTLQQIYNIHMDFLKRQYGEPNILLNGIFGTFSPKLASSVIVINATSHDIAREFFEHRNYTVLSMKAFEGINLDSTFRTIYELTVNSTEFWHNLDNTTAPDCEHFASKSILSEYQILIDYYKDIQASALRTYITAQLSYMILHLHESGDFRNQSIAYREMFRSRNAEIRTVFKSKLPLANKDVWTCDASDFNAPGLSHEITNFLQGYIDAEVNLNADGSCALTCESLQNTKHYACHSGTLCAGLKPENRALIGCKGKVRGCHKFDDSISVCPVNGTDGSRYTFVKSSTGLKLGNETTCTNELRADSWQRWFVQCSNCFCYCDDIANSDRYFSLREVVSNIQKNHIVTGISLTKRNGVIQFAIAERQLKAFGHVDTQFVEYAWKLGDHFVPNDNQSIRDIDYHVLTWEKRALNLDSVIGPIGTVVTGVRFIISHNNHLQLAVRFTEYDADTGALINLDGSFWLSNPDGGKHRINTDNYGDLPTRSTKPSIPHIKENGYIRFQPTHKTVDLSQRTVPFVDGLKVEPKKPAMLSGLGLFYKLQKNSCPQTSGCGGYVAPKIILNFDSIIE